MTKDPLVSIITPTYNRADFIEETVKSVLGQTVEDFEFLIVDDGSDDNTKAVLEPYLTDERISYFYQKNQGQSVARNLGLANSRGRFICFLDSDNAWLPDKLKRQISVMQKNPDVDIVYGDGIIIDEQSQEVSRNNIRRYSGHIAPQMLKDNCVSMNTAMARRRCFEELGGMSGKRRVADDYDLWLRFSAKYKFLYVPEYFAKYRVMEDQISSDKRRRLETNERIIHDFLQEFPDAVTARQAREGLAAFYARKARYYATVPDRKTAFESIFRSLMYQPLGQVPWRAFVRVLFPK